MIHVLIPVILMHNFKKSNANALHHLRQYLPLPGAGGSQADGTLPDAGGYYYEDYPESSPGGSGTKWLWIGGGIVLGLIVLYFLFVKK
ncbi:MAG: hypothetical protein IPJ74_09360 [Saprospiraceae bacterium]|nr:hypothetical protein [Saprospiraceae bacterium]